MPRMLLVRNNYDTITFYMHEWSLPLKEEAERKGMHVDCVDGKNVTRKEVISRLENTDAMLIILNGHGTKTSFFGSENHPILTATDASLFAERVVFVRACDCAAGLGREAAERHGCTAFIGYQYEFVNVRQNTKEARPLEDEISRPIWEASNAVPLSLIKGRTVEEAVQASHTKAEIGMLRLLQSPEPHAISVLKAMLTNDVGLCYFGEGEAAVQ